MFISKHLISVDAAEEAKTEMFTFLLCARKLINLQDLSLRNYKSKKSAPDSRCEIIHISIFNSQ